MKGGRKNMMKRAMEEQDLTVEEGQRIMQVLSLRGSNIIEVMNGEGEKSLARFPAKFHKSMWIKTGNFVVVDESGKDEATKSGSKFGCQVVQVLFYEQVRRLQKSSEWPEIFKSTANSDVLSLERNVSVDKKVPHSSDDEGDDDDDGLPPLEANTNGRRPIESLTDEDSSSSETDS